MPEEQNEQIKPVSPLTRFREARWLLVAAAALGTAAVAGYEVPAGPAIGGWVFLALIAAFVPRRPRSRILQVAKQSGMRRMWPGTGMKLTVDALPAPCFIADSRGITRYVNRAAGAVYGSVKPGDPLSFSLRAPSLLEAFDRVCTAGASEKITWVEKVPTEAYFEASLSPIYMPVPTADTRLPRLPDFVLVVISDLTEQRRLERMRTDFVANASHELRTPLASLAGFIETLQGPAREDPEARDRFLQIMFEQAGRMRRLIDDILSLSRIELKAHVKPANKVDLVEIARHTSDALAPLARELGMEIKTHFPDVETMVVGDRDELIQVAENLVENALKYGSNGKHIDVTVTASQGGPNSPGAMLSVRDYGEGIAEEHVPRLTERFYRVDVDSSRALKGTGLGLAIVKHILTRHRSRLEIDSTVGKGSEFRVRFPSADAMALADGVPSSERIEYD
ncbi:two-component system phosphate regulon sensor histidine kinase PhoR [Roseibium hamelinense]|uniref:histidine kinase n=2 Tax=Roseibium hamelinense TaxID=150831 RepID=A0A562SV55_9HYPH|nr:ATP-binding protein [Roseibium hamelinense]MTI42716.1 two-component sensor histidine kinase [Roseibium hamelinense]TWI84596.1 two-component system phosphate regulon sensor histidine kinase PhoR [Roseibium hamelinense]